MTPPGLDFTAPDYVIRVLEDPSAIDAAAWDALLMRQHAPTPFMRHAYLRALHDSGSAVGSTGWLPQWLCLHDDSGLAGACALYLKSHSWGEYVFDWAWADAYRRHGLRYYPKLLGAVPFTPVPGTRLLARDAAARTHLIHSVRAYASAQQWSSAHVLFVDEVEQDAFAQAGWLLRAGVQFHWEQSVEQPVADFTDLLARMQRDKRKKIQQERRRVAEQGVHFTVHEGAAIDADLWAFFHRCYVATYDAHQSTPYLHLAFFEQTAATLPDLWVMFVARRGDTPIAASLVAVDPPRGVAWGRYWGCIESLPCVHFEACYYQPLAWCLSRGYRRFEGGAQGEHKMHRGLLPVATTSAHWIADERFAQAIDQHLTAERAAVQTYREELECRTPFKRDRADPLPAP